MDAYTDFLVQREERLRDACLAQGVTETACAELQSLVLDHYACCARAFPWRLNPTPYRVLVSELMLQQTQTIRVAQKFTSFIQQFPTIESLASAPLSAVLAAWQGLGYNRRAKSLHDCAAAIRDHHAGQLPDTPDELRRLPGIGPATAASIAAFAFGKPTVFLETNIRAVLLHLLLPQRQAATEEELLHLAERVLRRDDPRAWYNALMDYGAWIKSRTTNPSRRSVRHRPQSRFEGSRRQLRGAVLRNLVAKGESSFEELSAALGRPQTDVEAVVEELVREGMLLWGSGRCRLA